MRAATNALMSTHVSTMDRFKREKNLDTHTKKNKRRIMKREREKKKNTEQAKYANQGNVCVRPPRMLTFCLPFVLFFLFQTVIISILVR